jgi:hypothetical protein
MIVEHLFWHFLRVGSLLVIGGLVTLVLVIPFASKIPGRTTTRTEFFSARAAYWCVIAGLAILMVMSTGLAVRTALGGK